MMLEETVLHSSRIMNKNDAQLIAAMLSDETPVTFGYAHDEQSEFVLMISCTHIQIGRLPIGGDSNNKMLVGVLHHNFYWFNADEEFYASNVAEKLKLGQKDSISIAELLNNIREYL